MDAPDWTNGHIWPLDDLVRHFGPGSSWKIVWTNGCFDLLHVAHVDLLRRAASYGEILIVGVNSDAAVKALKGKGRPLNTELDRASVVVSVKGVNYVTVFDDELPCAAIKALEPDVVVKGAGGGWDKPQDLPEYEIVKGYGGRVVILDTDPRYSSSDLLGRINK